MDLNSELMDFVPREVNVQLRDIFPGLDIDRVRKRFGHLKSEDPHQTIFNVARELWNEGYSDILRDEGFWDERYPDFTGHCHQCTPELGLVLKSLGFDVSYLECRRVDESINQGMVNPVSPEEEPNPQMRDQFCEIGRIPYLLPGSKIKWR